MKITAYDESIQQDDSSEKENGEGSDFDITEAVHKLGLEESDSNINHSFSGNGALLSLMLLRHLKIKDLRKSVICFLIANQTLDDFVYVDNKIVFNFSKMF